MLESENFFSECDSLLFYNYKRQFLYGYKIEYIINNEYIPSSTKKALSLGDTSFPLNFFSVVLIRNYLISTLVKQMK